MQSFRQYRRMRQDLQERVQSHGLYATSDQHGRSANDIIENLDDARREKGVRSIEGNDDSLCDKPGIALRNGQRVIIPGAELRNASEVCGSYGEETLFIVSFDGINDQLNPKN